ncbi:LysR family transcriptional regulator [Paenibacillus albicereus]|uniref:LysR family transcriptional regulator n=1 Tax=Paenibacillus albicereus TaxID=2726185 RepID=A0A6H2GYX3_9BACL|nr:LysR family transcriptional regulator [Paenibacillus albicereus]QJC52634.1 LysR family transcriptional regulator [Paenibacillus albicereus]
MELRQLHYFAAICKDMHFSKAAEALCTTQSNLSQQIKFLENELGTPLFDRMGRRIALTEAGRIVLEQSRLIFERVDTIQAAISDLKRMEGGQLDIGILPGDGDLLFDALLIDFHRSYPKLSIQVTETTEVYGQVLEGVRDIGVTTTPDDPDDRIAVIPLFHEEFVLAVRSDHPASKAKAMAFEQLQQLKLVAFGDEHQMTKVIRESSRKAGILLDRPIVAPSLSTLLALVEQGVGACILPRLLVDNLGRDSIDAVTLLNPTPSQDICILYRKDRFMSQAAKLFMELLQDYIHKAQEASRRSLG